jgi:hypothetical protein
MAFILRGRKPENTPSILTVGDSDRGFATSTQVGKKTAHDSYILKKSKCIGSGSNSSVTP